MVFSVFVVGFDMDELVVDMLCGVFDGYIVMSWDIVEVGCFFVIDVLCLVLWLLLKVVIEVEN